MASPFDLSGRTAVVTGANTGLGQAIAVALAQAGAGIVAVGRSSMAETGGLVARTGRPFHEISADLATLEPVARIVAEAEAAAKSDGSRLDILVNNAGIIRRADALDFTEADWDAVMDVNLKSTFFLTQAVARRMLADGGGGKVVNIASLLAFQGGIRIPSYTASKSGLAGLTRLLACEWAGKGINVNAIAPGYFVTNNTQAPTRSATPRSWPVSRPGIGGSRRSSAGRRSSSLPTRQPTSMAPSCPSMAAGSRADATPRCMARVFREPQRVRPRFAPSIAREVALRARINPEESSWSDAGSFSASSRCRPALSLPASARRRQHPPRRLRNRCAERPPPRRFRPFPTVPRWNRPNTGDIRDTGDIRGVGAKSAPSAGIVMAAPCASATGSRTEIAAARRSHHPATPIRIASTARP